jgi:hypothetical protein
MVSAIGIKFTTFPENGPRITLIQPIRADFHLPWRELTHVNFLEALGATPGFAAQLPGR